MKSSILGLARQHASAHRESEALELLRDIAAQDWDEDDVIQSLRAVRMRIRCNSFLGMEEQRLRNELDNEILRGNEQTELIESLQKDKRVIEWEKSVFRQEKESLKLEEQKLAREKEVMKREIADLKVKFLAVGDQMLGRLEKLEGSDALHSIPRIVSDGDVATSMRPPIHYSRSSVGAANTIDYHAPVATVARAKPDLLTPASSTSASGPMQRRESLPQTVPVNLTSEESIYC